MIDWVLSLLFPLTLLLAVLLISHGYLLKMLGVSYVYRLWLMIPLGLILFHLPISWQSAVVVEQSEILRFVVGSASQLPAAEQQNWLIILWLVVTSLMIISGLISHGIAMRHIPSEKMTNSAWQKILTPVTLPKKLNVYQSHDTTSPILFGLFEQKLIIPFNFQQLYNQEQQQLILEHEICHFDRNDIYWNLLAFVILALFWFHPLVWLAYFRYRRDQELSCDNIVLARKKVASRVNYSKALLVTAETSSAFAFAQLSFKKYGDKDIMFERIKQIQLNTKASFTSLAIVSLMTAGLLSGLSYAGNISSHKVSSNEVNSKHPEPPKVPLPPKPPAFPQAKESLKPIHRIEPKYPEQAIEEKIEGAVVLKFDVDQDGDVQNVEVINGKPAKVFDSVAETALKQWKYASSEHYHKNQLVQLDFRLDQSSDHEYVNLIEKIRVIEKIKVTK